MLVATRVAALTECILLVRTEEVLACNDVLVMKLCGIKLDKKDTFGKSDPFLVFYKCNEDQR